MIGAERHLALLDEAVRRFEEQRQRLERPRNGSRSSDFSPSSRESRIKGVFDDLDYELCMLDSMPLLAAYVRAHPEEFQV